MSTVNFPAISPDRSMVRIPFLRTGAVFIIALSAAFVMTGCATEGPVTSGMLQEQIRNARTASDHEALAQYFQTQAADAKAQAARHRKMAETYQGAPTYRGGRGLASHCESIARSYENLEKEQLAMADLHKRLAAEAGSSK
ncbi:MAG: hypothetical protein ACOZCP_11590 [Pseudomonadota bacterium]